MVYPNDEVDFCGHATLASSYVLFKDFTVAKKIQFHVKDLGIFIIHQAEDGKIQMNFPFVVQRSLQNIPELLKQALSQAF